jgi:hypothetical protein
MAVTGSHYLSVLDVSKALAFVGELSMGQSFDHSLKNVMVGRTKKRQSCLSRLP